VNAETELWLAFTQFFGARAVLWIYWYIQYCNLKSEEEPTSLWNGKSDFFSWLLPCGLWHRVLWHIGRPAVCIWSWRQRVNAIWLT